MIRVGVTVPSFVTDIEIPLAVAARAEGAGLDAVFAYDHLFRRGRDGERRPAIECFALLGALAQQTSTIVIGSLVARATLRPPAVLAQQFASLVRMTGGRVVAAIGAGDQESRDENVEYGIGFGTLEQRVAALVASVAACRDVPDLPIWVGGTHPAVRAVVGDGVAWNCWDGDPRRFAADAATVRAQAPGAELTWGGLVVVDRDDDAARAKAERLGASSATIVGSPQTVARAVRPYCAAGASTIVFGPVDSRDPANCELLADVRAALN